MISTLDPEYFAREIRVAFAARADVEQSKKQNYIELDPAMMNLITTSHYLAKGKPHCCNTALCRQQGQGPAAAQQEHAASEGPKETRQPSAGRAPELQSGGARLGNLHEHDGSTPWHSVDEAQLLGEEPVEDVISLSGGLFWYRPVSTAAAPSLVPVRNFTLLSLSTHITISIFSGCRLGPV